MWITDDLETLSLKGPSGVTIGAFDGVHRGHQALVRRLIASGRLTGRRSVVVTFNPIPLQFFTDSGGVLLTSVEERAAYMEWLGVDGMVALTFDRSLADTSAEGFITLMLHDLNMESLWIGPDFALGHDRQGDDQTLHKIGERKGFSVHTMPPFCWQGESVRSTRIREILRTGDVELANDLLGHPYRLRGHVAVQKTWGYAPGIVTACLEVPSERVVPAPATYVGQLHARGRTCDTLVHVRGHASSEHIHVYLQLLADCENLESGVAQLDVLTSLHPVRDSMTTSATVAQFHRDKIAARQWLDKYLSNFAFISTQEGVLRAEM